VWNYCWKNYCVKHVFNNSTYRLLLITNWNQSQSNKYLPEKKNSNLEMLFVDNKWPSLFVVQYITFAQLSVNITGKLREAFLFWLHNSFGIFVISFANLKNSLQIPWGNLQYSYRLLQYSNATNFILNFPNFLCLISKLPVLFWALLLVDYFC
jgi:hypothetical protein